MNDSRLTFFALPQCADAERTNPMECVVDSIGMIFETVHTIFEREPELFDVLSTGAVFVPLYVWECAGKQGSPSEDSLLPFLFSNLEYSFSQQEFLAYLAGEKKLPVYTESIHPQGRFWQAVAQGAVQEDFDRLMTAIRQMLSALDASSDDVLSELLQTCNLQRMVLYCQTADTAESIVAELMTCYEKAMAESGDAIPAEERAFLLSALVLYSIWELCADKSFALAAESVPMVLAISAADFCAMMEHAESRETLESLFACTDTSAGGFWKTLYAAARKVGEESLVAETAGYLEALLKQLCGETAAWTRHRDRLFALVS